ncbi:YbaK/EbsC family protein [Paucilactobacillus nenjiangensis]|uniref:YbaK/EbsC family protein n=1 Tax=Paucilactobacillus nenjiangensis TaxID=1296540 RepID=UPI003BB1734E
MGKKKKVKKTLVEQILDKHQVNYEQTEFPTKQEGDVQQLDVNHGDIDEHLIYKTLVLTGPTTGPVVGVVPVDWHLNEKKLAKESGNKKVSMVPLTDLLKTTGYEHGANTPIGIYEKFKYPIYIDQEATTVPEIYVSSGKIGRSIKINAADMASVVNGKFVDLKQ